MTIEARRVDHREIEAMRDLYRQEMNCQIVHDSLHSRQGWTETQLLIIGGAVAGYGSIAVAGPWTEKPTVFEFYVLPGHRSRAFDLFETVLAAANPIAIESQSNDPLLSVMMFAFAHTVTSESILFHDELTTAHAPDEAIFRSAVPDDASGVFPHEHEPVGDWVLEVGGAVAATGGILFHYNRPYGDIYMEVADPFRRRGLGSFLVQELKRVCYEEGSRPAARCNPANIASRKTLQRAGFVPCGQVCWLTFAAGIPLLIGSLWFAESWAGRRQLEKTKARLAAEGFETDPAKLLPLRPPGTG